MKLQFSKLEITSLLLASVFSVAGCAGPVRGPDKQFSSALEGAVTGAGSGAVTGFQLGSGTGPGALVGSGIGAVAGGIQGFSQDQLEEELLKVAGDLDAEKGKSRAQAILSEHYRRRISLHPTRDIFPADIFFEGDRTIPSLLGEEVLREFALLNKRRMPWSRVTVASYVRSNDPESSYANHLAGERAKAIGNSLVKGGLASRRVEARAVIMPAPLLLDPADDPDRYSQAIEFIPSDR